MKRSSLISIIGSVVIMIFYLVILIRYVNLMKKYYETSDAEQTQLSNLFYGIVFVIIFSIIVIILEYVSIILQSYPEDDELLSSILSRYGYLIKIILLLVAIYFSLRYYSREKSIYNIHKLNEENKENKENEEKIRRQLIYTNLDLRQYKQEYEISKNKGENYKSITEQLENKIKDLTLQKEELIQILKKLESIV